LLRIVPPASPTVVGNWVQEMASAALARRGIQLAEIESLSPGLQEPSDVPPLSAPLARGPAARDTPPPASSSTAIALTSMSEAPTSAWQPSSLSLRPAVERPGPRALFERAKLAGAFGGAIALAAVIATLLWANTRGAPNDAPARAAEEKFTVSAKVASVP